MAFENNYIKNNYSRNNYNKNNYNKNNENSAPTFPTDYLKNGYFEDENKKIIICEYIVEYPKHIVKNLMHKDKNKSSQLRKYYDYVIRIKESLKYNIKSFEEVIGDIKKLDYYVTYAETRGKVTNYFVEFIKQNLKNINTKEDFFAFATHFEAIIAYLPKER